MRTTTAGTDDLDIRVRLLHAMIRLGILRSTPGWRNAASAMRLHLYCPVMRGRGHGPDAEQRRESRRQALLDAALELFATRGYLDSPIELLCQTAQVSTKSFYGSFDSREACYLGLMERSTAHLRDPVVVAWSQLQVPPTAPAMCPDALRGPRGSEPPEWAGESGVVGALLRILAHAVADDPRHAIVLFGKGSATSPVVEQRRRANRRWAAAFLTEAWRQLLPDGTVVPHGVVVGAVGGIFDIIADWVADREDPRGADPSEGSANAMASSAVDIDVLHGRLAEFYAAVRAGVGVGDGVRTSGKEILSGRT